MPLTLLPAVPAPRIQKAIYTYAVQDVRKNNSSILVPMQKNLTNFVFVNYDWKLQTKNPFNGQYSKILPAIGTYSTSKNSHHDYRQDNNLSLEPLWHSKLHVLTTNNPRLFEESRDLSEVLLVINCNRGAVFTCLVSINEIPVMATMSSYLLASRGKSVLRCSTKLAGSNTEFLSVIGISFPSADMRGWRGKALGFSERSMPINEFITCFSRILNLQIYDFFFHEILCCKASFSVMINSYDGISFFISIEKLLPCI